jgi:hypothetical protein
VRLVPPVLVSFADSDCLCPTVTSPKLRAKGLGLKTPGEDSELFALKPWQPINSESMAIADNAPIGLSKYFGEDL